MKWVSIADAGQAELVSDGLSDDAGGSSAPCDAACSPPLIEVQVPNGAIQRARRIHEIVAGRGRAIGAVLLAVLASELLVGAVAHAQDKSPTAPNAPVPAAPAQGGAAASPAVYDKTLGVKGWNLNFPSFGDTVLQDVGGFRSALAQYGIGFSAFSVNLGYYNLLDNPRTTNGKQSYLGQQISGFTNNYIFLTVDLSRYGIPDGQIVAEGTGFAGTLPQAVPVGFSLGSLTYYQSMFDRRVVIKAGYISNSREFVGSYVGGSIAGGVFGPSATIPAELGLSQSPAPAPGVDVTLNITDRFYDKVGIQRSINTSSRVFFEEKRVNPTGLKFTEPGSGLVYINELGYQRPASPGEPQMWVRGGGIYNASEYRDYANGGKGTNYAGYVLADRQLWQSNTSSPMTAYQGVYFGASAMYAKPDMNVYSQYYEGRLYAIGLIPGRPFDLASLVATHNVFSGAARDRVNSASSRTQVFARSDATSATLSYSFRVRPGVYVNPAFSYTDHPSFVYVRKEGSALNAQANLIMFF